MQASAEAQVLLFQKAYCTPESTTRWHAEEEAWASLTLHHASQQALTLKCKASLYLLACWKLSILDTNVAAGWPSRHSSAAACSFGEFRW